MKKYLTIIMSVVILASCSNFLDTYPSDQISSETMWTSENLADKGMAGLYKVFPETSDNMNCCLFTEEWQDGMDWQLPMALEFQTVCVDSENFSAFQLTRGTKDATTFDVKYEWQWAYTGIHRVNDAIENLYKAGLSEDKYERYVCEAKFLRAFFYTRLNKFFQGVPIYLETITESECTKGQSTAEEVWEVVINDLTDCIECENFPDNTLSTSSNYGRPSKGAAYSLRGMAYMWMAWLKGEDNSYYQLAANDFEKVSECGYGLWAGNFIDFFHYNNEKDHEMIFPIQYNEEDGYGNYLQMLVGPRDMYNCWSQMRPSFDFVTYFQNEDGSTFNWADKIPEWNDDVFQNNIAMREVFFLRNYIEVNSNREVQKTYNGEAMWDDTATGTIQERVNVLGEVFDKYYLPDGNEERLKSCFENRDPRLKEIVLTPYEDCICYNTFSEISKQMRWPAVNIDRMNTTANSDIYIGESEENMYIYLKYNYHRAGDLVDRFRGPTDWPLIRYTDVYLLLAECYVHLGRLSDAASIVNDIRDRAHMPSISVGSSDEVMEAVRYERRVELCLEGHDYFDEWRWGTYKDMKFQGKNNYGVTCWWGTYENYISAWYYTDNMWPWGAPSEECQRNPNMTQKSGWAY